MSWTEEKVTKLRELWGKGHTASEIAEKMGGTTRNAVIGKAHRLNLESRVSSKKTTTKSKIENKQHLLRFLWCPFRSKRTAGRNSPPG